MRNKYKKKDNKDKINISEKNTHIIKNYINNSSSSEIKRIQDKKIDDNTFERTLPIYNKYEKINYIKEKNTEKIQKKELLNDNKIEKEKTNKNIINNKKIRDKYQKIIININKGDKKMVQDNKSNDVNNSNSMVINQKSNIYNKCHHISSNIKNNQINKENTKKIYINKNEIKSNNNNIKLIYKKEKKIENIEENDIILSGINLKQKKNFESSPTESFLKSNYNNKNIQKNLNKEINNINLNSSPIGIQKKYLNNEFQEKESFKYLVHQASKNRDISNSFQKYYEQRQLKTLEESNDSNLKDESLNSEDNSISKYKFKNLRLFSFSLKKNDSSSCIDTNIKESNNNSLTERKLGVSLDKNNFNTVKIINYKYNINEKENKNNNNDLIIDTNSGKKHMTQNIINNNIYNTTVNFYKIDNVSKSKYFRKTKNLSAKNLIDNDYIIYENAPNKNKIYNKININNINNYEKEEYSNKNKNYENLSSDSNSTGKQNIITIKFYYQK